MNEAYIKVTLRTLEGGGHLLESPVQLNNLTESLDPETKKKYYTPPSIGFCPSRWPLKLAAGWLGL